ncbi:MAG TPA: response regulator [Candidatus Portnoybacteria bacterium]|nr:response regulator [Candidatus Portnoybacteria bacterium]
MKKILFIEDEPSLRKSMRKVLEKHHYSFLEANNGESGVQIAEKELPDLILLDLILPKKNGFEALEELKNNSATNKIPVIVLTNLNQSQDIEKALSLGAISYLVKANYSLAEIIEKIKNILG